MPKKQIKIEMLKIKLSEQFDINLGCLLSYKRNINKLFLIVTS